MSGELLFRTASAADAEAAGEMVARSRVEIFRVRREALGDEIMELAFPDVFEDKRRKIAELVRSRPEQAIVAEVDGEMAGLCCWDVKPGGVVGELLEVTVDPDHQRRGIGRRLCRRALEVLGENGCRAAVVKTGLDAGHAGARRLYQGLGFACGTEWVHYYRTLERPEDGAAGG